MKDCHCSQGCLKQVLHALAPGVETIVANFSSAPLVKGISPKKICLSILLLKLCLHKHLLSDTEHYTVLAEDTFLL